MVVRCRARYICGCGYMSDDWSEFQDHVCVIPIVPVNKYEAYLNNNKST